jgi:hypothetical protein
MFSLLHIFSASLNKYRKQKTAQQKRSKYGDSIEAIEDIDWEDDPNVDENAANDEQPGSSWSTEYEGFTRNPIFVRFYMATQFLFVYESNSQAIVLAISMLTFVRNRSTNRTSTFAQSVLQDIRYQFTCHQNAEQYWGMCIGANY